MTKKLFEDLTEQEITELTKVEYDPKVFDYALDALKDEIEMYDSLGSDFRAEYREANRMYKSLKHINEWMKVYNCKNEFPEDDIVRVTSVSKLHVYFDAVYIKSLHFEDYEFCSGMFTPLDIYVFPVKWLNIDMTKEGSYFTKHLNSQVRDFLLNPSKYDSRIPRDGDGVVGSLRIVSPTHCAMVVREQDNPLASYINRSANWRFIHKDGSAC